MLNLFTRYSAFLTCLLLLNSPSRLQTSQDPGGSRVKSAMKKAGVFVATGVGAMANRLHMTDRHEQGADSSQQQPDSDQQHADYTHGKLSVPPYCELGFGEKTLLQQEVLGLHRRYTSDKPLVLFFGNTGSCKSTIIKYLLGVDLIYKDGKIRDPNEDKNVMNQAGNISSPKIGHTQDPETMGIHLYDHNELGGLAFADTEGFLGKRIQATRVEAIMAEYTPYFTLLANTLQGVVIVVDSSRLRNPRDKSIQELANTIMQYFGKQKLSNINKSFTMIVTRMEDIKEKTVKEAIKMNIQTVYKNYFNKQEKKENNLQMALYKKI